MTIFFDLNNFQDLDKIKNHYSAHCKIEYDDVL